MLKSAKSTVTGIERRFSLKLRLETVEFTFLITICSLIDELKPNNEVSLRWYLERWYCTNNYSHRFLIRHVLLYNIKVAKLLTRWMKNQLLVIEGRVLWRIQPKKKSSGVDNWYLVDFFEELICGRWYIYIEQTIYHLCRPISCRLSSPAVEYHLLWTIISYVVWYLSPADNIQLKQMILIWRGWYSSRADNIQLKQMIHI
jgi:hypothetical protein